MRKKFHKAGQPVFQSGNLRKAWDSATQKANCPDLLIHDLRRSGIRNLTTSGVQEKVAMLISGHKTRSVFDRYNIVAPKQLLDAMSKVEENDGNLIEASNT